MSLKLEDIKIDKEYAKLVPPLSNEEYAQLKSSIRTNGLYLPIVINENNTILDGHHRYKICKELEIQANFKIKKFESKTDEIIFVGESNLFRRQLTVFARIELVLKLKPHYQKQSKERMLIGKKLDPVQKSAQGKTRDLLAKKADTSHDTIDKVELILEKAPEDLKEKVRIGQTSINYAYKTVNRQEKKKNAQPIPTGQFNVILADPPWKYDINTRGSPDDHYDVMEDEDISKLNIPSADNCVLFMWGTAPKLPEALQVIEDWGFTYKTNMVWVKDKIGTGYYFRGKHELLFVAVKGNPLIPEEADRPESVLIAPRTKHSKKPEEIYGVIERMYPDAKYLELFARNTRSNWKSWGNEIA
jgi:N6-adenosine-specific RNA methylase IME4/ParB-like chromosome segregation protein Spo0J